MLDKYTTQELEQALKERENRSIDPRKNIINISIEAKTEIMNAQSIYNIRQKYKSELLNASISYFGCLKRFFI